MSNRDPSAKTPAAKPLWLLRLAIVAVFIGLIALAYASDLHRQLSLDTLVRHRAAIDAFIAAHYIAALAIYVGVYVATVSLSIPAALLLTIAGGILFGPIAGPLAAIAGSSGGATVVFLIAKTALGESLVRRAGPFAERFADGFKADAFSYLLFLRLVPIFPFWLVNLAPALFGIGAQTFILATVIGVAPAAFAYGFVGAGLDSVIAAQETAFKECLSTGAADCRLNFDLRDAVTPQLLVALAALGVVALIPVAVRRWRGRKFKSKRGGP
jgi:uncharacterized membrane protein YdjX (TVP38/TMEM64 family)